MIAESMKALVKGSSVIRAMFEEGNRLARIYGAENVYDFSLGNPNVAAPAEVNQAIKDVVDEEDSVVLHGYMSNSGFEDVREAVFLLNSCLDLFSAPRSSRGPFIPKLQGQFA